MKPKIIVKTKKQLSDEERIAINIMRTAYSVRTSLNNTLKQYALTPEQYNILRILKGAAPDKICVKQIAERLIERNANVPRTVDKLVAKKLVKRSNSSADKRETVMEIAMPGIKLLEVVMPEMEANLKNICNLSSVEIGQLSILLDKYRNENEN
ncbi:hypothetical protein A9P82_12535 [Arachidicoccus ginsenosidimutans]|uniref:MarR family winged helix-turn-helix transcriptional regulator n=1 Tax=Arachidicoccus sp. BS20 TaxID=1850526 RepID=UPI0007F06C1D|nr:MarR family winged helix-turn-helix transcriptional regulator [Arachidicoccus sp. BS20]ANI90036.1 hypothetical protein A9P82_12535 [Arachidicoccus sp. BS20]